MKKKVYLVQPGYLYGSEKKSAYLPYAAGTIAAYSFSLPQVRAHFAFGGFLCFFEDIDSALDKLSDADVVGFSNYVWNYRYNCALARRLKQRNPRCTVIFGGHQIEKSATPLTELPFADYLVFGEGEAAFAAILETLCGAKDRSALSGVSYRDETGAAVKPAGVCCPGTSFPSPYLEGWFDPLLEAYPDVSFIALFETNRGCPFRCAYCDWGTTKEQIRLFPMERVAAEIAWFAAHRIVNCFAADANFGLFPRDEEIAQMLIRSKRETGYPQRFDVTYAKSDSPRVFRIVCALLAENMSNIPSISFQSLNPATLEAIGRKNMSLAHFTEVLRQYESMGIHPYSEIILGLPEETLDSFTKGIGTLLALGQHHYIDIFRCELLSNSMLAGAQMRQKYNIRTRFVPPSLHHVDAQELARRCGESELVVATSTMSEDDMLTANLFSMTVQACHHMGLTKYIAIFLYQTCGVPYEVFYTQLVRFLERHDEAFRDMKRVYAAYLRGDGMMGVQDAAFGAITWFPEELYFLKSVSDAARFYRMLTPFAETFVPDARLAGELIRFQSLFAVTPRCTEKSARFGFDFGGYFFGTDTQKRLAEKDVCVRLELTDYPDWETCAKQTVWYGRRRSKTDAFLSAIRMTVE